MSSFRNALKWLRRALPLSCGAAHAASVGPRLQGTSNAALLHLTPLRRVSQAKV